MGFEFSELVTIKQQVVELNRRSHSIHMKVARRIALLAIRKVKQMTPVAEINGGTLRDNWKHHVIKRGDDYTILIYNQVEYASFVELGHRIVVAGKTVGWVEGRFMLKLTMGEMEQIAPNMWKREVEREMGGLFD